MQPVIKMKPKFWKKTISSSVGLMLEKSSKDPLNVTAEQLRHTFINGLCLKAKRGNFYSHPVTSEIRFKAAASAEKMIEHRWETNVSWKSEKKDDIRSSVGCLQRFRNKFQSSLKA